VVRHQHGDAQPVECHFRYCAFAAVGEYGCGEHDAIRLAFGGWQVCGDMGS